MKTNEQFIKMTTKPIPALIGGLAVPTILSMLVTNVYNMVDTAFVGLLGTSASGAVGVVFGYMAILQAIGFMCGQGAGSVMSRKLGAQNFDGATRYSSTGFFFSFGLGLLVAICSFLFLDPLITLLGSTKTIAPYAKTYISYIIFAAPFLTASLTMNNLLRYEGRAKLGTIGLMTGSVLNIFGDALFMFGMHMGIAGAGLSTCLSQIVSFSILLYMYCSGRTQTLLNWKYVARDLHTYNIIFTCGFPSLLRQTLASVSTMLLNGCAAVYGDEAVAAMSIVSRISFFVLSIALGMGQGFQPVSSFNYGAGKYSRVRQGFWFTLAAGEILLICIAIPVYINAGACVRIFRDDPVVVEYAIRALRLQCVTLPALPLTMMVEMGFQSTGQRLLASVASSLRSGIIFIPSLLVLATWRGLAGIQEAQPAAYILSIPFCVYFIYIFLKKLPVESTNE